MSASSSIVSIHQPITIGGLTAWEYLKECCKDGPDLIREKFDDMKPALPTAAETTLWLQGNNKVKNQFSNIPCLDHLRVPLGGDGYIHANYVDSFQYRAKFIMTQAPPLHVMSDFWKMVTQEDVAVIVMLTRLCEHGKMKSSAYWPEIISETHRHGIIYIQNVARTEHPGFDHAELDVAEDTDMAVPPEKIARRRVHHLHYYDWPDHNMPTDVTHLVELLKKANVLNNDATVKTEKSHKIIVHCSAGVGRSGVFVMLDILTQQCKFNGRMDIPKTLKSLRSQRAMSVNSVDQFCTLHMALLYFLVSDTKIVQDSRFIKKTEDLLGKARGSLRL